MTPKRVAVLMNKTLLMSGVAAMLVEQPNLSVSAIAADDSDLESKLSDFGPEVVVLDGEDTALVSHYSLYSLLQDHPDLITIALTIRESIIRTYTQRRVVGAKATDILDIIAGLRDDR